jgi:protein required for attachment to host cells
MLVAVRTWIVLIDGARARVLEEPRRHAMLHELADWADQPSADDRRHARHQKALSFDRFGQGRHNVHEVDEHDETERAFIGRFARRLTTAGRAGAFDRLVLIAPPKALGLLKAELEPFVAKCIELTEPHDRTGEDPEAVRRRLHDLRIP